MICPYWMASEVRVAQSTNDIVNEESGVSKGSQEVTVHRYTPMECKRGGRAAWRDGACHYAGQAR